jgi:hypothetical protein
MKEVIQPYIDRGFVSYYLMTEKGQETNYNRIYPTIREECKWLIICDTDEYIYNRTSGQTLPDFLQTLDGNVSNVYLHWKMFSSSGLDKQPESIRTSFVQRWKEPEPPQKNIVQTANTLSVGIHSSEYKPGTQSITTDKLELNHYAIMSREYFEKVKMTRGDVNGGSYENIRDWTYFDKYDRSEKYDDELANLVHQAST